MLGESKRGEQNQSITPCVSTSAAVCRSPMSPWSAIAGYFSSLEGATRGCAWVEVVMRLISFVERRARQATTRLVESLAGSRGGPAGRSIAAPRPIKAMTHMTAIASA